LFTREAQESILSLSLVDRARRQIGLFTSLLLVVSAVIIALIIYTMTMEKLKQIATLKLIGAPDRTIVARSLRLRQDHPPQHHRLHPRSVLRLHEARR
jgi:ABC-type antimicrobial peptide transport system permease subunit